MWAAPTMLLFKLKRITNCYICHDIYFSIYLFTYFLPCQNLSCNFSQLLYLMPISLTSQTLNSRLFVTCLLKLIVYHRQNMPSACVPPLACLRRGAGDYPTPCCPLFSLEWAGWGWGYAGPDAGFWLCSNTKNLPYTDFVPCEFTRQLASVTATKREQTYEDPAVLLHVQRSIELYIKAQSVCHIN